MESPFETAFDTPDIRVGELYPALSDKSSIDTKRSPPTEESYWDLTKSMRDKAAKKARHEARVLDFGTEDEKRAMEKKKEDKAKSRMRMKWHSAEKARQALASIQKLGIDPGHGYKLGVVRDTSVKPPPMPPRPPSINAVLMKAAESARKEETKKEKKATEPPSEMEQLAVMPCPGCNRKICPRRLYMLDAVAVANSLQHVKEVVMMNRKQRIQWFIRIYNNQKGVHRNARYGIDCAESYAEREMNYLTAAYIFQNGLQDGNDDDDRLSEVTSYESSKVGRQMEDYQEYLDDIQSDLSVKSEKSVASVPNRV
jgi:hypothetical protein